MRIAHRRPSSIPASSAANSGQGSGSRTKFTTKRVLVVDDLDDNRELFATILRERGLVVTTANDGVEALDVVARERPDVILMDLAMPRMDGFEAIERLRRADFGCSAYIIVVSAFADRGSRLRAEAVGANAFLTKPCTPRALIEAIEAAFATLDGPRAATG
jgi:CheY-like chemotaxis protein